MIVKNNAKAVIVLKAIGLPNLRLFPGYNTVDEKEIGKYFEGNPAAKGQQKMYLSVVEGESINPEDKIEADKAKKKNELLNKAQRVVKAQKKSLAKNDETISTQSKLIEEQAESIKELQDMMKKLEETVVEKDKKKSKK